MCLLGVRLGAVSGARSAVGLVRVDVERHVDRRQRDIGSGRRQLRSANVKNFATWPRYQARFSSALSPLKRVLARDLSGTTGTLRSVSLFSVLKPASSSAATSVIAFAT